MFTRIKTQRMYRKSFKQNLYFEQRGKVISLRGNLANYQVDIEGLIIESETNSIYIKNQIKKTNYFDFDINLKKKILFEGRYSFYLHIKRPVKDLTAKRLGQIKYKELIDHERQVKYRIRLGRFNKTNIGQMSLYKTELYEYQLYTSVKGNITLSVGNEELNQKVVTQIDTLKTSTELFEVKGKLFTRSQIIETLELALISREGNDTIYFPVRYEALKKERALRYGLNRYAYAVRLDFADSTVKEKIKEGFYDLFFKVKFKDIEEERLIRLGRPRFRAKRNMRPANIIKQNQIYTISSYYTFRLKNLTMQVDLFEKEVFYLMEKLLKRSTRRKKLDREEEIWIIGERSHTAQDTGLSFFQYMQKNHPEINSYYVIEEDSPDLPNLKGYKNILYYKSKEHVEKVLKAKYIVGSHHPDYLYPLRTETFKRNVSALKVFIQHGVIGTKNMVANYGIEAEGFETDLFLVSYDFEKEIIMNDFGYKSNNIKVTGLSRFDKLFKKDIDLKKQILIMPTWREWLTREDLVLESEYLERYQALLNSPEIKEEVENKNITVKFYLHPNMQKFTHLFKSSYAELVTQDEKNIQTLIKESSLMITDYTSAAFDFSFLKKPVIYYQFDRERFIGKRGSHIDLDNELPGDIVFDQGQLNERVIEYIKNNFINTEENIEKANKLIKYKDLRSSERIYNEIVNYENPGKYSRKLQSSDLFKSLKNKFMKSKRYFPVMKLLYRVMRIALPVKKGLIVFESGVGKQYSDSPRVIYEQLVKEKRPYQYVWVNNSPTRYKNLNTKRIRRLSPSYYYYLARAEYWVNNQNFPHYIKKSRGTTYLQTWHGTPLKKMQHDIKNIIGRDEGYLDRVSKMTDMWDYLISPSSYASARFRSAFKYEGEIIETGYPRNDLFYNDTKEQVRAIKKRLRLESNKTVILYAPTFRDNQKSGNAFNLNLKLDLKELKDQLGDDYVLLLRMHVIVKNKIIIPEELTDFVKDVSNYDDIQELLLVSDLLITDYSSVMFDFANTNKPMIFYTYDYKEYEEDIRGFYIDFKAEAPGPLVETNQEVINAIKEVDTYKEQYRLKYQQFYKKYCENEDGHAAKRVVDKVFK